MRERGLRVRREADRPPHCQLQRPAAVRDEAPAAAAASVSLLSVSRGARRAPGRCGAGAAPSVRCGAGGRRGRVAGRLRVDRAPCCRRADDGSSAVRCCAGCQATAASHSPATTRNNPQQGGTTIASQQPDRDRQTPWPHPRRGELRRRSKLKRLGNRSTVMVGLVVVATRGSRHRAGLESDSASRGRRPSRARALKKNQTMHG